MLDEHVKALLQKHEGRVPHLYYDSLGYASCGVGFLIDPRLKAKIPEKVIDFWLEVLVEEHWKALVAAQPWVENLSPVRAYVMLDMTYNLGIEPFDGDGFKDWPIFVEQVRTGQYEAAAKNMRSTLWAKQVKGRAETLAVMMETDAWPPAL